MNWGILGHGKIAPVFIESLRHIGSEKIVAVASASAGQTLTMTYPEAKIYNEYESIYSDPEVDIIYISTTHNFHAEQSIRALQSGKHVLCEKPIGINLNETESIIHEAKKSGKFYMEALWTRFLPAYIKFKSILNQGHIGKIKLLKAEFAFKTDAPKEGRLLNPALAGGALLDIGVYPISLLNDVFSSFPTDIQVQTERSSTGVDLGFAAQLEYEKGVCAQVFSSLGVTTRNDVIVYGEKGWVWLDSSYKCQKLITHIDDEEVTYSLPYESTGYTHEIREVVSCIQKEQVKSDIFSWEDSLASANMVELIRNEMLN